MLDRALRILSHEHRRRLLTELFNSHEDDRVCVPEEVVRDETQLERAALEFHHKHLPLLEDAEYVRWDRAAHAVERGPKFDEIAPLIDLFTSNSQKLPCEWV